MFALGFWQIKK